MQVKNVVLGLGIVIVFALALWQGIEAFYPTPQYNDFCDEFKTAEYIDNANRCEQLGGKWNAYDVPIKPTNETGYCDRDYACRMEWEQAQEDHSKIVFFISLIIALIIFIVGYFVLSIEPVGSALIGSGIWAIFYGTVVNWRNFSDIWRFLLLLAALILLIWLAIRFNTKKKSWFSWK